MSLSKNALTPLGLWFWFLRIIIHIWIDIQISFKNIVIFKSSGIIWILPTKTSTMWGMGKKNNPENKQKDPQFTKGESQIIKMLQK